MGSKNRHHPALPFKARTDTGHSVSLTLSPCGKTLRATMAASLPTTAARLAAPAFAYRSPNAPSATALPRAAAFPAIAVAAAPLRPRRAPRPVAARAGGEERETILLPGCDYNHWLIVMEFPKDPAPTREQMIDTYLNTLATVLGRYPSSGSFTDAWQTLSARLVARFPAAWLLNARCEVTNRS
jgi:hypothetical protein